MSLTQKANVVRRTAPLMRKLRRMRRKAGEAKEKLTRNLSLPAN